MLRAVKSRPFARTFALAPHAVVVEHV